MNCVSLLGANKMIIDSFAHWLIDRSIERLTDWLTDCLIDRSIDQLIDRLIDRLIGWLIGRSTDWSIDLLIGWLIVRLIDWSVDGSADRSTDCLFVCVYLFIAWLIDWLIDALQNLIPTFSVDIRFVWECLCFLRCLVVKCFYVSEKPTAPIFRVTVVESTCHCTYKHTQVVLHKFQ